jgi:hypothetical protein
LDVSRILSVGAMFFRRKKSGQGENMGAWFTIGSSIFFNPVLCQGEDGSREAPVFISFDIGFYR